MRQMICQKSCREIGSTPVVGSSSRSTSGRWISAQINAIQAETQQVVENIQSIRSTIMEVNEISASIAAAALLGAPLGHDFATVSLSDLLTPWELVESRLEAAAAADFAVVLYNPRSARRDWQLERARQILLDHRSPATPVGVVSGAGRPAQAVEYSTLRDLDVASVTMTSCVIVGSSQTRMVAGRMVTPRGYQR